jgi:hypothetical protein
MFEIVKPTLDRVEVNIHVEGGKMCMRRFQPLSINAQFCFAEVKRLLDEGVLKVASADEEDEDDDDDFGMDQFGKRNSVRFRRRIVLSDDEDEDQQGNNAEAEEQHQQVQHEQEFVDEAHSLRPVIQGNVDEMWEKTNTIMHRVYGFLLKVQAHAKTEDHIAQLLQLSELDSKNEYLYGTWIAKLRSATLP